MDMSVQHLTIDDTRAWFQAGDREVFVGDVLDLVATPTTRVRFARYGKGAMHEWMVTVDETLIVTKGALLVRAAGSVRMARAGEVVSLAKGTRVVFRGEEDGTEVVFVTYMHWADAQRQSTRSESIDESRPVRGVTRLVPSLSVVSTPIRKGA
jgi:ethanolamine utilization protein EutQ (cupin superfamily)